MSYKLRAFGHNSEMRPGKNSGGHVIWIGREDDSINVYNDWQQSKCLQFLPCFSTNWSVSSPVGAKNSSPPPAPLQWHLTFQTLPPLYSYYTRWKHRKTVKLPITIFNPPFLVIVGGTSIDDKNSSQAMNSVILHFRLCPMGISHLSFSLLTCRAVGSAWI